MRANEGSISIMLADSIEWNFTDLVEGCARRENAGESSGINMKSHTFDSSLSLYLLVCRFILKNHKINLRSKTRVAFEKCWNRSHGKILLVLIVWNSLCNMYGYFFDLKSYHVEGESDDIARCCMVRTCRTHEKSLFRISHSLAQILSLAYGSNCPL